MMIRFINSRQWCIFLLRLNISFPPSKCLYSTIINWLSNHIIIDTYYLFQIIGVTNTRCQLIIRLILIIIYILLSSIVFLHTKLFNIRNIIILRFWNRHHPHCYRHDYYQQNQQIYSQHEKISAWILFVYHETSCCQRQNIKNY